MCGARGIAGAIGCASRVEAEPVRVNSSPLYWLTTKTAPASASAVAKITTSKTDGRQRGICVDVDGVGVRSASWEELGAVGSCGAVVSMRGVAMKMFTLLGPSG